MPLKSQVAADSSAQKYEEQTPEKSSATKSLTSKEDCKLVVISERSDEDDQDSETPNPRPQAGMGFTLNKRPSQLIFKSKVGMSETLNSHDESQEEVYDLEEATLNRAQTEKNDLIQSS